MTVANAGHPAPLRWNHGARQLVDTRVRRCLPLGLQPEWTGEADPLWLAPGDALLLYTDGVVDVKLGRRERLGTERLTQLLGQSAPENANQWLARLLETLDGCAEWPDDVTALALVRTLAEEACRAA